MRSDDWEEVRFWAWTLAVFILGMFAGNNCQAQSDKRWSLMPGRDSLAIGPLDDVRRWAGLRIAKNIQARQCAFELITRDRQVTALLESNNALSTSIDDYKRLTGIQADEIVKIADHNRKLSRKLKRRNPLLYLALGAGGVLLIQQQLQR